MTIFLFVIFSIFIVMKKIVRLTEDDLTRIVKRVIQEEQLNERLNLKSFIPALAIVASLNLSSCKTKSDFEKKIPEIEAEIKKSVEYWDKVYQEDWAEYEATDDDDFMKPILLSSLEDNDIPHGLVFKKVTSIEGPIKECPKCDNIYYIIYQIEEDFDNQMINKYKVALYQEDKSGKGRFTGDSGSYDDMNEVKRQIKYIKKYGRWDYYSNYSDYMDDIDLVKVQLESMMEEYSEGRHNSYGSHSSPSDYYRDIELHMEKLNNIKTDSKEDLKSNNISKKEYDIIIEEVENLLSNFEDFKYKIR